MSPQYAFFSTHSSGSLGSTSSATAEYALENAGEYKFQLGICRYNDDGEKIGCRRKKTSTIEYTVGQTTSVGDGQVHVTYALP